ncbi:MAG: hypothetical protein ACJ788_25415 [Ktedonobacteraceae bacterium]
MKQMRRLIWLIPLAFLLVGVFSFAYTRTTSAAANLSTPTLRMFSRSYPDTNLTSNPDGYTTVETITFKVGSPAKLEVTSANNINRADGVLGGPTCQINLDGVTLYSTINPNGDAVQVGTVTDSSVPAGTHTLTIACNPNLDVSGGGTADAWGSVSAIVSTGL